MCPKVKAEFNKSHIRIKKQLELKELSDRVIYNKDYKKIKKNISHIEMFLKDCSENKIELSQNSIDQAKKTMDKLLAERNLRF